jgi:hypothetical protein
MKKHFINVLVAVSLLATLNSCSKDGDIQPATSKPITTSANPLDPGDYGYIDLGDGELYYYEDGITTYNTAGKNYLLMKPLSLEKYKNGQLLDSVCNKDLAVYFPSKVVKTFDKSAPWGPKKRVAEEFTPIVTITTGITTTIKLSKMVSAFGYEFNSPHKGYDTGIDIEYWNSKLNRKVAGAYSFRLSNDTRFGPVPGTPGGALLEGLKSDTPFDEIRITFTPALFQSELNPPFDISFGGFRYTLAK